MRLSEMEGMFEGRAVLVLGGGPSLVGDVSVLGVRGVFEDAVKVGVNHHAAAVGLHPDYVVFYDDLRRWPVYWDLVRESGAVRVAREAELSDVEVDVKLWLGSGSGTWAASLACYWGGDPVVLCGMDLYQGERKHCHDLAQYPNPIWNVPLDVQLWNWGRAKKFCPGWERIRVVSGPLGDVFGVLT